MRRIFVLTALLCFLTTAHSYAYNMKRGPQVIASFIKEIQSVQGDMEKKKAVIRWMENHPDILFPLVEDQAVTFVYADVNMKKSPVEKVSLAYAANKYTKNELFLDKIENTPLFIKTIKVKNTEETAYNYYIQRKGKTVKAVDPFNPAVHTGKKIRNAVIDPGSSQGTLLRLQAPRPDNTIKKRSLWIYLPPGYYLDKEKKYPVLYMQDGQNLWSGATMPHGGWQIKKSADRLIKAGKIEPMIIIGVDNSSERNMEYVGYAGFYLIREDDFYKKFPKTDKKLKQAREKSLRFTDYYTQTLIPWVESRFRIAQGKQYRSIAGSSFGAGVSLYLAYKNPDMFSAVGSLSGGNYPLDHPRYPTRPFDVFPFLIDQHLPRRPVFKIYLHCGDQDLDKHFLVQTKKMHQALVQQGWTTGKDLMYIIDEKHGHNENTWKNRMDEMLLFFYGK